MGWSKPQPVRWSATLPSAKDVPFLSGRTVLATVYDPSDGTGEVDRLGLPPWPAALELVRTLNETLRQVAAAFGACVADVHGRFLGHGLEAGDPNQPDPRPADRSLWYCGLIEPNAWGASEIRAAFWGAIDP